MLAFKREELGLSCASIIFLSFLHSPVSSNDVELFQTSYFVSFPFFSPSSKKTNAALRVTVLKLKS